MRTLWLLIGPLMMSGTWACHLSHREQQDTPTTGVLTITADETFKPVLDAEIQVFEAIYRQAKVHAEYKAETEALNDLLRDSVEIIISARPLNSAETKFLNNKKLFPKNLKIAKDAIALIINKNNPLTQISVETIKSILKGELMLWKEIDSSLKLGEIKVVFDNQNSSTVRFVIDSLCKGDILSSKHFAVRSNPEVIYAVTRDIQKIGIIGVSWISDIDDTTNLSFLKQVKVLGVSKQPVADEFNSFQPFQAYMATSEYPLVRDIYVINAEPRSGLATGFAAFLASDRGQRIILKSGILPTTQPYRIIEVKDNF